MRETIYANRMTAWEEWRNMVRLMHDDRSVVCAAWRKSFVTFFCDMGRPPHSKHLKRHDESKEFCKENCYWG